MKTTRKWLASVLVVGGMLSCAVPVNAAVVWNNGSSTTNTGGYCGSCGAVDTYTMFDNFSLSNALSGASVEWDASFNNFASPSGQVRVGVWNSYNSAQVWSGSFNYADLNVISVNTFGWAPNLTVSTDLTGLALSAGDYWISFSGEDMYFNTAGSGNSGQVSGDNLGNGGTPQRVSELAFRLSSNDVPEPGSLALLSLGLAGLGAIRRKQNKV